MKEKQSILVVDDDPDSREIVAMMLESSGYQARMAEDGEKAFGFLKSARPPDLIILDMNMPVLDGPGFLVRQRKTPKLSKIPVILVSASHVDEMAALKPAGFLQKPVPLDTLIAKVKQLIK